MKLLTSVPGIGEVVAVSLISSLPELGKISHKSISYLVGVAPLNKENIKLDIQDNRFRATPYSLKHLPLKAQYLVYPTSARGRSRFL